jgi:putative FmdB family regulatory protein
MPIFTYKCTKCGHEFEVMHSHAYSLRECCPVCGATTKRLIKPVNARFKGPGFYETDYKRKETK